MQTAGQRRLSRDPVEVKGVVRLMPRLVIVELSMVGPREAFNRVELSFGRRVDRAPCTSTLAAQPLRFV